MASLDLQPGFDAAMDIDVNRREVGPLIVYDGPIESKVWGSVYQGLPEGTRLYGRVWTGGPRVVIRYYSARLPNGKIIPLCAVAAERGHGIPKTPGRPGSAAVAESYAGAVIVYEFR